MDGGDAFFADELVTAALEGKTKFSSADTQVGNYDQTWLSERVWDNRTSLIIDPPDGRIPRSGAGRGRARRAHRPPPGRRRGPADRAQDLSLGTRCVSYGTPNIRAGYQSYFEITQGPGVVALRSEMIHDARIFPIDGGAARRRRRSGSTTATRARAGTATRWSWTRPTTWPTPLAWVPRDKLHTIEKFRRVAEDTLEYYVTFDDPTVWSRPWTLMIPLKKTGERMFEFACHEGNYGLPAILRGAREQEKNATR